MSNDLFGIAVENRKSIKELIIVSSPRIGYHPLLEAARNFIPPLLFENLHLISLDKTLINGLIVCKHCHMLFTDARWNRSVFLKHLRKFHVVERKEPKPEPKNNPFQFTETPVTINLVEPDKVTGNESGNPGPEVEIQPAAQAKMPEDTQSVRKSHHKKNEKCLPQPVSVPQCVDTIYDWEAPLGKKPRSQKRKANPTGSNTVAKKKACKKPKLGGEENTSTKPYHSRPPHAKKTPKAHAKEAERKEP